jgi:hypothetical protein
VFVEAQMQECIDAGSATGVGSSVYVLREASTIITDNKRRQLTDRRAVCVTHLLANHWLVLWLDLI